MTGPCRLKGEEQGKCEYHHYADQNLQWQSDFDVIHESVLSGRHDQCIGRRGERRGKTHAGSDGYRKKERIWADCRAMGARSTAVAVLLINMVSKDVVK